MLSDYVNSAKNIRNSYLVRILSSKKEDIDAINNQYGIALTKRSGFDGKIDMISFFTIDFKKETEFKNFLEILLLKTISDGNFSDDFTVADLGDPYFYLKNLVLTEELNDKNNLEYLLVRFPNYLWYLDNDIINMQSTIDILVELIVLGFERIEDTINKMLEKEMKILGDSTENLPAIYIKTKTLQNILTEASNLK